MYKLMIVDDEYATRHGLKVCIDWASYGIEVVGEAENGKRGLELVEQLRPDIVLSDVRMPYMDGIEMSKLLKQQHPEIKIVFISGYDDIEYLKSAMKVDAVDYILKPVNLVELQAVIEKIMAISKREADQKDILYRMNAKLNESIPLLREKFFIQLVRDRAGDRASLEKRVHFLELQLPYQAPYCTLIISIDNPREVFETVTEKETELISFSIQNICQEIIDLRLYGYAFEHQRGEYVLIVHLPESEGEEAIFPIVDEIKSSLLSFLHRFVHISLTIGVGKTVERLDEVAESYEMAAGAIEQKLFLGKNQVITFDVLGAQKGMDFRHMNEKVRAIVSLLKTGDAEQVGLQLDNLFQVLSSSRSISQKDGQRLCLQLLLVTSQFLSEFGMQTAALTEEETEVWEELTKVETLEDMHQRLKKYLTSICESVECRTYKKTHDVIHDIFRIVQERYADNLTIADIASQVYLAKTYICLLFKQETGETINEYITRVRMEKSKQLLTSTDQKLAEICTAIGYTEPSYFSKQFRKYTGMNPSEYRDIHKGVSGS